MSKLNLNLLLKTLLFFFNHQIRFDTNLYFKTQIDLKNLFKSIISYQSIRKIVTKPKDTRNKEEKKVECRLSS